MASAADPLRGGVRDSCANESKNAVSRHHLPNTKPLLKGLFLGDPQVQQLPLAPFGLGVNGRRQMIVQLIMSQPQRGHDAPSVAPAAGDDDPARVRKRANRRVQGGVVVSTALALAMPGCGAGHPPAANGRPAGGAAAPPATSAPATAPGAPAVPGTRVSTTTGPPSTASAPSGSTACRHGDPLANVYHPYRLKVRKACLTVTGVVAYISAEADGDVHVDLALPASEAGLLDDANRAHEHGELVTEIVPADQPGCVPGQPPRPAEGSYRYGTCTGADVPTPPLGASVIETGPYVLDADHGWMEIHPVWRIVVTDQ